MDHASSVRLDPTAKLSSTMSHLHFALCTLHFALYTLLFCSFARGAVLIMLFGRACAAFTRANG